MPAGESGTSDLRADSSPTADLPGAGILEENPGALAFGPEPAAALIWAALESGCRSRESPWRLPVLASVSTDSAPEARVLVLRGADSRARHLELHSDSRSGKFDSLRANPRVELCFWHPGALLQLRAAGHARVVADAARRERAWARVPDESRGNYQSDSAPGSVLRDAGVGRLAGGFAHFAILQVQVERLEWLWLGGGEQQRGRLVWSGAQWEGVRLVP